MGRACVFFFFICFRRSCLQRQRNANTQNLGNTASCCAYSETLLVVSSAGRVRLIAGVKMPSSA